MQVPVVLQAPPLQVFRETFEMQSRGFSSDSLSDVLRTVETPDRFQIDAHFAPVPIRREGLVSVPTAAPNATAFLMRGTLDVGDVQDVPSSLDGNIVFSDALVDVCASCFDSSATGTRFDVERLLGVPTLREHGLTGEGVAIAIVDTGISLDWLEARLGFRPRFDPDLSWKPADVTAQPGAFPVGHGTMCAYAALIAAPDATLIDIPALVGSPAGGAPIGRRVSEVYAAIAPLVAAWTIAFTPSGDRPYKALVLSNSWAMFNPGMDFPLGHPGRYADNPRHFFTSMLTSLSEAATDVVFAAGNCGSDCPRPNCQGVVTHSITGANASRSVLTVAGCDVDGVRVGYSSVGPGIAGMANEKPDLVSYTHFLGSEALGAGVPDKGTSTSCPLVAGCVAALRSGAPPTPVSSEQLNTVLRQTARQSQQWSADVGFGLLDVVSAGRRLGVIP